MRTIKRGNQFKKDYKREIKGRSLAYVQKLDAELAAVFEVLSIDGILEPRYRDHQLLNIGRITGTAISDAIWC